MVNCHIKPTDEGITCHEKADWLISSGYKRHATCQIGTLFQFGFSLPSWQGSFMAFEQVRIRVVGEG